MEKFALLDFLKVFEALSGSGEKKNEDNGAPVPEKEAPPPRTSSLAGNDFNAMANVISRHEEISNRIKNNRR